MKEPKHPSTSHQHPHPPPRQLIPAVATNNVLYEPLLFSAILNTDPLKERSVIISMAFQLWRRYPINCSETLPIRRVGDRKLIRFSTYYKQVAQLLHCHNKTVVANTRGRGSPLPRDNFNPLWLLLVVHCGKKYNPHRRPPLVEFALSFPFHSTPSQAVQWQSSSCSSCWY